ncbi:MAG: hypothetical protein M1840_008367 [Geoglossum simile]|nr:MAG: hypothetical protein M1840_008367 [Geoglossum simile]
MTKRRIGAEDYTVGWVCALPIEFAAAQEMLDEEHQDLPQDTHESNLYTLGRIGNHNVVLSCLPAGLMGNNPAAAVAFQIKSKFTSIRLRLLVGIGGGLGDVAVGVVSQHTYHRFCHLPEFARENAGPDILFQSDYNHIGGTTCDRCSSDALVERTSRSSQDIVIHYGTIASGNQVMKDGFRRDEISSKLGGVLCFEMEAAGLMNIFPCLVIRGICDYADS